MTAATASFIQSEPIFGNSGAQVLRRSISNSHEREMASHQLGCFQTPKTRRQFTRSAKSQAGQSNLITFRKLYGLEADLRQAKTRQRAASPACSVIGDNYLPDVCAGIIRLFSGRFNPLSHPTIYL
jgi:hypothetical protein